MKHVVSGPTQRMWPIAHGVPVAKFLAQLEARPALWDKNPLRTYEQGVHNQVHDIWFRYNALRNFDAKKPAAFNEEHDSEWYPAAYLISAVKEIAFGLMYQVEGERLGGILLTKIPPGNSVHPHTDSGWHAGYYRKFAVQIKAAAQQGFHFKDESLVAQAGEVYEFDNSYEHWVTNDSDIDRITLIVCIRTEWRNPYYVQREVPD